MSKHKNTPPHQPKLSPTGHSQEKPHAPGKEQKARPDYFPEDERSSMDWEDDHSHTEVDIDAEIEAKLGKAAEAPVSGMSSDPTVQENSYFPEDERSSMDWEDDSSFTDFDIDAEIEAKLGKENPADPSQASPDIVREESAPPSPSDLLEPSEHASDKENGTPEKTFFPEDERSPMDWEDDHSDSDIDLDAEIAAQLDKRDAPASGPASPQTVQDLSHPSDVFSEDERSPMDWEDDHSHTDVHLDQANGAEPESGKKKSNPDEDTAVNAEKGSNATPTGDENSEAAAISPGLAAALDASMAFAARNYTPKPDDEDAEAPPSSAGEQTDEEGAKSPEALSADADATNDAEAAESSGYLAWEETPAAPYTPPADAADSSTTSDSPEQSAQQDETKEQDAVKDQAVVPSSTGIPETSSEAAAQDDENDEEDTDSDEESTEDDKPMSLRDHLRDLRKRLLRAFLFMLAGFIICYPFAEEIFAFLFAPLMHAMPETSKLIFTSPPEAFFTFLKVAFVAGIFVSSPLVFYQIWAFVAPGLYKEEKLYIVPVALSSAVFFISGGAFCYYVAFPFAFEFFMSFNKGLIQAMPALSETLSFVLQLLLAFGVVFELPLFIFFLARLGIVTADMMRRFRRYALLVNVIVAAILTPPDVMSQMLMAGPLLLLYELSILIAVIFGKKKKKTADEEEEDEGEQRSPAKTGTS